MQHCKGDAQMFAFTCQPSEASSDAINLPQTVHIQPQPEQAEDQKELPEWSEKVAHGILSGTVVIRGLVLNRNQCE